MRSRVGRLALTLSLIVLTSGLLYAQGSTTSTLSGTVSDTDGGFVPGAAVVVKNNSTGRTTSVVTDTQGAFTVPALELGTYTVTITLTGFKTKSYSDVRVGLGAPASLKATLEIGSLSETVEVKGESQELVNTTTPRISSTLDANQINHMPGASRNLINAVTFLPGVNTATTNRNSTVNGLPQSFIYISLDGVGNNDNFNKSSDGFFASITPRPDAIEAVEVTTAAGGVDVGGHGGVTINFVTRSGTNSYTGSAYEYLRHPSLNTNYFFNSLNGLPKNDVVLNQYGARFGGPIVVPRLYDGRGKMFFFANYEQLRLPNNFTRTRTVAAPGIETGVFRYNVTVAGQVQVREVNVLALAAQNGQSITLDPTTMQVLADIRAATATTGVLNPRTDPNTLDYVWQSPGYQKEWQPVFRFDYNVTAKHRLSASYNRVTVERDPDHLNGADVRFPGFANWRLFRSVRPLVSMSFRSTLSSNLVNEIRGGGTYGESAFGRFDRTDGPQTFAPLGGFALGLPDVGSDLTDPFVSNTPSWRGTPSVNVENTLTWLRGKHTISLGGALYFGTAYEFSQQRVPTIALGVADGDPAAGMFVSGNFAGASSGQLLQARNLYALLTGRVTSIGGQLALDPDTGEYVFLGPRKRAGKIDEYSLYAQDSWRMKPGLTLTGGLRWDLQMPFKPTNDVMSVSTLADACGVSGFAAPNRCNFFTPGASGGIVPSFQLFAKDQPGYETDWNNVAPNIGVAWQPNVERGFLRWILGDPQTATLRAGYSISFNREGFGLFTGLYGGNPGSTLSVTRTEANGLLVPAGEAFPVLYAERGRLGLAAPCPPGVINGGCNPGVPTYPIPVRANRADDLNLFHPDIKVPFARSYTASFQRSITRDMAVDIRYVGTRGVNQWTEEDFNERNIIENGFFEEFQRAMGNLQANIAAGRGNTFAFTGVPGTSPLPIYLAYFNGRSDEENTAAYTGNNWTNATFVGRLAVQNPSPTGAAGDLDGNLARRNLALQAGLPANFFVVNPDIDEVSVETSGAFSSYNALQIELKRRLSRGLQISGSYQYALEEGSANLGLHFGRVSNPTANVRHAIKAQWNYSLPFGRGRRYGANINRWMDLIVGGWDFDGVGRVQARVLNFGNVRLVGMSAEELGREYFYRVNTETRIITMLPDDIILNTRRAFSVSATSSDGFSALGAPEGRFIAPANSPGCIQLKSGDCADRTLLIQAPWFSRFDISLAKRIPIKRGQTFELRFELLNAFDNINFNPVANPGGGATIFQVTSAYTDASNTFDPGGRLGQFVFRYSW
jgi:hypothetical protein